MVRKLNVACASCGNTGKVLDAYETCRRCKETPPAHCIGDTVMAGAFAPTHRGMVTRCRWERQGGWRYTVDHACGHYTSGTHGNHVRKLTDAEQKAEPKSSIAACALEVRAAFERAMGRKLTSTFGGDDCTLDQVYRFEFTAGNFLTLETLLQTVERAQKAGVL